MFKRLLLATSAFAVALMIAAAPTLAQDDEEYAPPRPNLAATTGMETRLSAVEDQLRALTGKVEQVDFGMRRMDMALQKMQADYDMRLTRLESAPPPTATVMVPQPAQAGAEGEEPAAVEQPAVTGTLGGVKVRGDQITGAVANAKAPPLPVKPDDYGLTAQEQYDRAFGLLRQANYEEAEKAFKGFITKYGNDKLIDNAKYWYAETHYVRGKFGDAAIAFADAYQQNPKGTKAPDSLLKMAMSLGSIEKRDDACAALSALKSKYPNAAPTVRARAEQERAKLKCK
ncbi:MAG TPA: tol-pal system protein YbgF [Rhodospirillaceae bacterium]|nr:tol-pal system protein YbgF [Rhodospirillaceae bacterium]